MTTKIRQELDQFAALILARWDACQAAKNDWHRALNDAVNHQSITNANVMVLASRRWTEAREDCNRGG